MAQYNIAARGTLSSPTTGGTGNKALTSTELRSLVDGTTASGGVSLSGGDNLYIDIDLGNRIYVDDFRVYVDSGSARGTVASGIRFFYSDTISGTFTQLNLADNGTFYYATGLPAIFAPLRCRTTISGLSCTVRELTVYNDDYDVAFGSDGSLTEYVINDAPTGGSSSIHTIPIFNNASLGGEPVTAFISIDYSTNQYDQYLKLSSDGETFYSWTDGPSLHTDTYGDAYRWSSGTFTNTTVSGGALRLVAGTTSGTYTTPIFQFNGRYGLKEITILTASGIDTIPTYLNNVYDQFYPSYVVTQSTLVSGTEISKTAGLAEGTMEVRSSNTAPLDCFEVYWWYRDLNTTTKCNLYKYDIVRQTVTNAVTSIIPHVSYQTYVIHSCVQGKYTGTHVLAPRINNVGGSMQINVLDYDFNILKASYGNNYYIYFKNPVMQRTGYVIDYSSGHYTLALLDPVTNTTVKSVVDTYNWASYCSGIPYGLGCWLYNSGAAALQYYDENLNVIYSKSMSAAVTLVESTVDGGCWTYENDMHMLSRFDAYGNKLTEIGPVCRDGYAALFIKSDFLESDGIWVISSIDIRHFSSSGELLGAQDFYQATGADSLEQGIVVTSATTKRIIVLSQDCRVLHWNDLSSIVGNNVIAPNATIFAYNHYDTLRYSRPGKMPRTDDPVWGTSGNLTWKEVKKDGYFLSKYRYHQFRYTLRSTSGSITPVLNGVYMPMSVKIEDIYPQQSKPLYIRAEFEGVEDALYTSKLKCWWTK